MNTKLPPILSALYSKDKRKRRRQHRRHARGLLGPPNYLLFNGCDPKQYRWELYGSTIRYHLAMARYLGR